MFVIAVPSDDESKLLGAIDGSSASANIISSYRRTLCIRGAVSSIDDAATAALVPFSVISTAPIIAEEEREDASLRELLFSSGGPSKSPPLNARPSVRLSLRLILLALSTKVLLLSFFSSFNRRNVTLL